MSRTETGGWLASHPKLLHALFVGTILLSQVGVVVANNGSEYTGP